MPEPGDCLNRLAQIMRTLRGPDGCPWDREQTLATLRPFLLEETYEALDAIDRGDMNDLREELGDLAFEIVFLAQICDEQGAFSLGDAIETVSAKLVRRHPHVFGDAERARSAADVLDRWEDLKREDRAAAGAAPKTLLEGVPRTLPGLLRASEYGSRAASVGFDWPQASDVIAKIEEEIAEVRGAIEDGTRARSAGAQRAGPTSSSAGARGPGSVLAGAQGRRPASVGGDAVEEEMGDLLFAIANLSRKLGVEPETALRRANDKFAARFTEVERRFAQRGVAMKDAGLDALEEEWRAVKGL